MEAVSPHDRPAHRLLSYWQVAIINMDNMEATHMHCNLSVRWKLCRTVGSNRSQFVQGLADVLGRVTELPGLLLCVYDIAGVIIAIANFDEPQ